MSRFLAESGIRHQEPGVRTRRAPWASALTAYSRRLTPSNPTASSAHAPPPCAKRHEEPAGNPQILLEVQELVAIAEFAVKQNGGGETKAGEEQRGGPGLVQEERRKQEAAGKRGRRHDR